MSDTSVAMAVKASLTAESVIPLWETLSMRLKPASGKPGSIGRIVQSYPFALVVLRKTLLHIVWGSGTRNQREINHAH